MDYLRDPLGTTSESFRLFVESERVRYSTFEKLCKFSHKFIRIRCPKFLRNKFKDPIFIADMKVNEDEIFSLIILTFIVSWIVFLPLILLDFPSSVIFIVFPPFFTFNALSYPQFHADVIRIRAGNETVSIILYMISYLSLVPVYELAIKFAASKNHGPLGNDLKKVVWDVELGKFSTIRKALSQYTKKWILWNEDFVDSLLLLQLIETQPSQENRSDILRKSGEKIMYSTQVKMEQYVEKMKKPSIFILLLGIVLPLMGLIMFPMLSIFLTSAVNPLYIGIGYTVILPFFLWWFLYRLISKRPATYSFSEKIEEVQPQKYVSILGYKIPIIFVAFLLGFVISLPGILYYIQLFSDWYLIFANNPYIIAKNTWADYSLEKYRPMVMLRSTFSAMFLLWGISTGIIYATYKSSNKPFKLYQFIRKLEGEFEDGLYELQNSLSQNVPVETAILGVINQYRMMNKEYSPIYQFFVDIYIKITRSVASVREALFGQEGILKSIPSSLIKSIMSIVLSAVGKGPLIAASVSKSIVSYLSKLKEIERMIHNLLLEILQNLEMQGNIVAPFIAAVVASAGVIIIQLLQAIAVAIANLEKLYNFGTDVGGSLSKSLGLINLQNVMPPTILQLIAGTYLIESIIIMSIFIAGIGRGFNRVERDYTIWKMLTTAIILFSVVFFVLIVLFIPIFNKMTTA